MQRIALESRHTSGAHFLLVLPLLALAAAGCRSPYAADRLGAGGAVLGGVTGAVVGHQLGHTAGGAVVGALAGGLAGTAIGGAVDESEARNRAVIESKMGRPAPVGSVTVDDILAMNQAGVPGPVIASHISNRGMAYPAQTPDIIRMQQAGVAPEVMQAAQRMPNPPAQPVAYSAPPPQTVIVHEYDPWYGYPYRRPYYHHHHHCGPPRPHVGVGFSYHHH